MVNSSKHPHKTKRYLVPLLAVLVVSVITAFGFTGNGNFELAKQHVLLRNIAHEILLQAGDSTSRVLPVREIAPNEYQLRFENEFTFQTDSLVSIIRRSLDKDVLAGDYIVNVLSCANNDILFGYALSAEKQQTIIPCRGRKQPVGCYVINIRFQDKGSGLLRGGYVVGGLSLFAFIGLLAVRRPFRLKRLPAFAAEAASDALLIGDTLFEPGKRQITAAGITTELTPKENKLLLIFAAAPGTLIERQRLQKEIWEDEGVIVGRSLDVFISKLRKKLEHDTSIKVVNVHGKGYRLQVGAG